MSGGCISSRSSPCTTPESTWAIETVRSILSDHLPRDPNQWVSLLAIVNAGVHSVTLPPGTRGTVDIRASGSTIRVSDSLTRQEQAFTVAHEVGHILLNGLTRDPAKAKRLNLFSHGAVEAACDAIARDLTVPSFWMMSHLRAHGLNMATLQSIAGTCDVPFPVAVTRAVELGAPVFYLAAERTERGWLVINSVGWPYERAHFALGTLAFESFRNGVFRLTRTAAREMECDDAELRRAGRIVELLGYGRRRSQRKPHGLTSPINQAHIAASA